MFLREDDHEAGERDINIGVEEGHDDGWQCDRESGTVFLDEGVEFADEFVCFGEIAMGILGPDRREVGLGMEDVFSGMDGGNRDRSVCLLFHMRVTSL